MTRVNDAWEADQMYVGSLLFHTNATTGLMPTSWIISARSSLLSPVRPLCMRQMFHKTMY